MVEQSVTHASHDPLREPEGYHVLDLLAVLARHKKLVIGVPLLTGILALGASMLMTPMFTSTAKVMPPQQQQSSGVAAMLGQLGGLAGAAGLGGAKNTSDIYVGMMESRSMADALIVRFKLKERYNKVTMDDTRGELKKASTFSTGKTDGMINISASDPDPKFAAELANAYVEELIRLTQSFALTEASQRRMFFEKQLEATRDKLADAEVALRTTQETTGMVLPAGQLQAIISTVAQLKGTIAAKEVEMSAMRTFATAQNPDYVRIGQELRSLQGQLAKMESNQASRGGDFMVPTGKIPAIGVEYVRSARNVKYYETIFELLAKQFELAKIDEAKDSPMIQVLDRAIAAERKSKPSRALITLVGAFVGAVLGVLLAFMRESYDRSRSDARTRQRWDTLAASFRSPKA